ncbi:SH3 and cysteine-rich domain-containing protein-like isoform X2 [Anneissia japonica]|uniref:SH3 and cysteine-rich domain-containing protein-like isoform X2 n=1 Tax=Anneissia japonica TaxID=1529436 RepID=UPI0014258A72|nr:SH3 and cysteine-rich domain-containing protein-like isoform X2 [Anneissia japonica]
MDAIVTLTRAVDAKENIGDMQFPSNKPKTSQYMFTKPEASVTGDFSQGKLIHHPSTDQSLQMTQGQLMKEIDDLENELSDLNDKLNKQKRYCESNSRRGSNVIKRSSEYQTDVYKVRNEMRKIEMIIKTKQSQLELFSSEGVAIKSVNGIQKNDYIRKSSNHISKMQNDLIRKEFEVTCKEVEDFTNREPDYLRDDFKHIKRENGRSKREPEQMRNEVNDVKKDGVNGQIIDYGVRRNSVGVRKEKEKKEKETEIKKSEKDAENRKTDKDESVKKEESTEDQSSSQSKSSFERALSESKDAVAELLEKGGRQHVFQDYNFKKPTFCDQCRGLLRGLIKQGLRCKLCKVSVHHKCHRSVPACRGAPSEKRKLLRRQKSSSEVEGPRDETPRIEIDPVYEAIKSASRMSVRNHDGSSSSRRKSSSSPTSPNHRHTTSSPGELLDYSNADSSSRDSLSPGRSGGATPKSAPHSPASSRRKLLKSYGKSMSLDAEPQAAARGGSFYGYRPRRQQSDIEQLEESDSESYIRSSPIGQVVSGSFRDLKSERDAGSSSLSTGRYDGSNRTLSKSPSSSTNVSSKDLMSSSQPVATECIALYNFEGSVPEDLTFSAGDKVYLLDSSSSEWWKGELDNKVGFFPAFCVEPIQRWERALRVTRSHKGSLEQPDGLNLRRDQIVIQMSNVESGWVTVRMGKGKRGSYPYCYLAPIHHKYFQWGDEIYK